MGSSFKPWKVRAVRRALPAPTGGDRQARRRRAFVVASGRGSRLRRLPQPAQNVADVLGAVLRLGEGLVDAQALVAGQAHVAVVLHQGDDAQRVHRGLGRKAMLMPSGPASTLATP